MHGIDKLTADIVESQKRRRLIVEGYKNGVMSCCRFRGH
jgi:hypothetical protein